MRLRRLKTPILFFLVAVSLVTSYTIWHGSWLVHSEVGLGTSTLQPAASNVPALKDVTKPQQIVLSSGNPKTYSVALAGNSQYQYWMSVLQTMTLAPLRSVDNFKHIETVSKVIFDLPVQVNRVDLGSFIPALNTATFTPPTNRVILFHDTNSSKIQFAIQTDAETYVASTNIDPKTFNQNVTSAVAARPWHLLSSNPLSLVPAVPLPIKQYQCNISQPKLTNLVDSFFVNTQAVTRIQENKGTVIYTDGSRAVQWNSAKQQMIFDDPNAASGGPAQPTSLSGALAYVRNHGGIPQNSQVYTDQSTTEENYVFRETVDGLPILNQVQQYRVLLQQGHIVEYDRPLIEIGQRVSTVNTTTISFSQLTQALNKAKYSLSKVQLVFGYKLTSPQTETAVLEPVYYIYENGNHVATLDAVNGHVAKGGE